MCLMYVMVSSRDGFYRRGDGDEDSRTESWNEVPEYGYLCERGSWIQVSVG